MSSDEDWVPAGRPLPPHRCLLDVLFIHLNSLDLSGRTADLDKKITNIQHFRAFFTTTG
jgi:hypothetical protein